VIDRVDPSSAELALRLIDALVFLPRPGSADVDTIRTVVDILRAQLARVPFETDRTRAQAARAADRVILSARSGACPTPSARPPFGH